MLAHLIMHLGLLVPFLILIRPTRGSDFVANASAGDSLVFGCNRELNGPIPIDCTPCDCKKEGTKSCDKLNGECLCHDHAIGQRCDRCAPGYYRTKQSTGACEPCNCHKVGSTSPQCESSGQCKCREGFRNRACDDCDVTHHQVISSSSLRCTPCECHHSMSNVSEIRTRNERILSETCNTTSTEDYCSMNAQLLRHCDKVTGQCSCLRESVGDKCEKCAPRYWFSNVTSKCLRCEPCSSSLMDRLDEIDQDLSYANRTVEKGRMSALIGLKISNLESAFLEHSSVWESSRAKFKSSYLSLRNQVQNCSNSLGDDISQLMDNLMARLSKLQTNTVFTLEHPHYFALMEIMNSKLLNLRGELQKQLDLLSDSKSELDEIDRNYLEDTDQSCLVEIDSSRIKSLIKDSQQLINNQSMDGSYMSQALNKMLVQQERISYLTNYIRGLGHNLYEELIASALFNSSSFGRDRPLLSQLEILESELSSSISNSVASLTKLAELRPLVDSIAAHGVVESTSARNLSLEIFRSELTVLRARKKIESSVNLATTLVANLASVDTDLVDLKDLTVRLSNKSSTINDLMATELNTSRYRSLERLSSETKSYQPEHVRWSGILTADRDVSEVLDHLGSVDELHSTLNQLLNTVNDSSMSHRDGLKPYQDIQSETKLLKTTSVHLALSLRSRTDLVTSIEAEFHHEKNNYARFAEQLRILNETERLHGVDKLNEQILKTSLLAESIQGYSQLVSVVSRRFTQKRDMLFKLTNAEKQLPYRSVIEYDETLSYLTGKGRLSGGIKSAETQLIDLTNELKTGFNLESIRNLTRFADLEVRRSIDSLRTKIDYARFLLDQVKLERNFTQIDDKQINQLVRLKNPPDLSELSTYTSVSISFKPDDKANGVILFIGTPTSHHRDSGGDNSSQISSIQEEEKAKIWDLKARETRKWRFKQAQLANLTRHPLNPFSIQTASPAAHGGRLNVNRLHSCLKQQQRHDGQASSETNRLYSEYLAVELRRRRLAVVLSLGSQILEEIVDDTLLSSGLWHRIEIVRVGTSLSLSVRSCQYTSSLTRPLSSPHIVLNLDTKRSEIFVGGSPIALARGNHSSSGSAVYNDRRFVNALAISGQQFNITDDVRRSSGFSGQVYDLSLNGRKLGLWNTVSAMDANKLLDSISVANMSDQIEWPHSATQLSTGSINKSAELYEELCNTSDHDPIARLSVAGGAIQFSDGYVVFDAVDRCNSSGNSSVESACPSEIYHNQTDLSFRFKTLDSNCLLLLVQLDRLANSFMAVQLNSGLLELVLHVNGTLSSSTSSQMESLQTTRLSDYSWHQVQCTVSSTSNGQSIHLHVDNREVGRVNLTASKVDKLLLFSRLLLLGGGLEQLQLPGSFAASLVGLHFTGCMQSISCMAPAAFGATGFVYAKKLLNVKEGACQESVRVVSFARPRSNISSSFVQFLNSNNELDEIMQEQQQQPDVQLNDWFSMEETSGHIRRLTIKFKTKQANGLLVHHSRPDHSSFISVYIFGGRPMLAVNFDKKLRFESHLALNDGQWHTLYLIVRRSSVRRSEIPSVGDAHLVRHSVSAILDDKYIYTDRFTLLLEPVNPKLQPQLDRGQRKRSATPQADESIQVAGPVTPQPAPSGLGSDSLDLELRRRVLYLGGVEDKYIPLLRNLQIPTSFHGCLADVTINSIRLDFVQTNRNQGVLMNQCQLTD